MRLSSASERTRILVMLPSQPTKQLISSVWVQSQPCDWTDLYSHQTNVPRQSKPRDPEGRPAESSFLDVQRGICWVWCKDFQGFQYNRVGSCIRFQCWDSFVVVKMSQINAIYAQKYISCWLNKRIIENLLLQSPFLPQGLMYNPASTFTLGCKSNFRLKTGPEV